MEKEKTCIVLNAYKEQYNRFKLEANSLAIELQDWKNIMFEIKKKTEINHEKVKKSAWISSFSLIMGVALGTLVVPYVFPILGGLVAGVHFNQMLKSNKLAKGGDNLLEMGKQMIMPIEHMQQFYETKTRYLEKQIDEMQEVVYGNGHISENQLEGYKKAIEWMPLEEYSEQMTAISLYEAFGDSYEI